MPETGNPFYNPNMPGPDWGTGIAAIYANIEKYRQQKLAEKMAQDQFILEQQKAQAAQKESEARGGWYAAQAKAMGEKPVVQPYGVPEEDLTVASQFFGFNPKIVSGWSPDAQKNLVTSYMSAVGAQKTEEKRQEGKKETAGIVKPDIYDKKVAQAAELVKAGKMSPDEFNKVATGTATGLSDIETKSKTLMVDTATKKAFGTAMAQNRAGALSDADALSQGINLDMPLEYNLSVGRAQAGLGTEADAKTINKFESLWKLFRNDLFGKYTYEQIMSAQPDLVKAIGADMKYIKQWYDKYGQSRGFLGIKGVMKPEELPE